MTERTQWILGFSVATFFLVLFITVLLVRRHGHTVETTKILEAIEGGRQQQDAEHSALQHEQRAQGTVLRRILDRLGFLRGQP